MRIEMPCWCDPASCLLFTKLGTTNVEIQRQSLFHPYVLLSSGSRHTQVTQSSVVVNAPFLLYWNEQQRHTQVTESGSDGERTISTLLKLAAETHSGYTELSMFFTVIAPQWRYTELCGSEHPMPTSPNAVNSSAGGHVSSFGLDIYRLCGVTPWGLRVCWIVLLCGVEHPEGYVSDEE